jgi:hypothetical protein
MSPARRCLRTPTLASERDRGGAAIGAKGGGQRQGVSGELARFAGPVVATVAFVSLWLPWLRTGTTRRSAFRLVAALRAAGLMSRGGARLFFVAIALVPGVVGVAWLLGAGRLPRLSALATLLAGLLTAGAAFAARHVARQRAAPGTAIAAVAGLVAVIVGMALIVSEQLAMRHGSAKERTPCRV